METNIATVSTETRSSRSHLNVHTLLDDDPATPLLYNHANENTESWKKAGYRKGRIDEKVRSNKYRVDEKAASRKGGEDVVVQFFSKLRSDGELRRKLLLTLGLWFAYFTFGVSYAQVGTSLPDLKELLGISLDLASWLISFFFIGYLLGSLLGGWLVGRVHAFLLLSLCCLWRAVLIVALPWSPQFWLSLVMRTMTGAFSGALDTVLHAETFNIWKLESGRYVQILHLSFSLGAMVSPIITEPFLAKRTDTGDNTTTSETNSSSSSPSGTNILYGETKVHIAFLIAGGVVLVSAVACFLLFIKYRKPGQCEEDSKEKNDERSKRGNKSNTVYFLSLANMALVIALLMGCSDTVPNFLMSFVLYQLDWSKTAGSWVTTVYWTSYAVGNVVSVVLLVRLGVRSLIYLYNGLCILAVVGLLVAGWFHIDILVWVSLFMFGFSVAYWPCYFAWTEEFMTPISGRLSSFYLVVAAGSMIVQPIVMGYMMDEYSPMWLVYLALIEAGAVAILFTPLVLIYRQHR